MRKTRIDELPQLLSVLIGEMSLVGPRPERPSFVEELKVQIPFYEIRHTVKPGITGWAQVRYHYGASMEDARRKHQFDLYYARNSRFWIIISACGSIQPPERCPPDPAVAVRPFSADTIILDGLSRIRILPA
jgi:lipopolysaccharide/colanic/teichoic acid biosynthesis glycosyltransferase